MHPFFKSFTFAWNGLRVAFSQRNMRIHGICAILVIVLGFYFSISAIEWCVLLLCIALVIAAECLNTAIELISDFIQPQKDEKIKIIKDVAAAAVLICAVFSVIIGCIIFIPKITF